MKTYVLFLLLMVLPVAGWAAEDHFVDPKDRKFPADYHEVKTHPEVTTGIQKYAPDAQRGPQKNFGLQPIHDNEVFFVFRGDRLEYQTREGTNALFWDIESWLGKDYNKIFLKSEGAWLFNRDEVEEAQLELYWSRNISTFWDFQLGFRQDFKPEPTRTFAAFGFEGLVPYWFEAEITGYVSGDGDVSAKAELEYDLLLTQRLILQPRFETTVAVQEVNELGVGQGINYIELGLRLRYEIRRELAPYVGVSWNRKLGETMTLAKQEGENFDVLSFVGGIKFWF